jgi:hypothetical protein
VDKPDDGSTSEDSLHHIVYGPLPVPADVEHVGDWTEMPGGGEMRPLFFPALYALPRRGPDGEVEDHEVRLIGYQQKAGGTITYAVGIQVCLDGLTPEQALLIAAAIRDVAKNAINNNEQQERAQP